MARYSARDASGMFSKSDRGDKRGKYLLLLNLFLLIANSLLDLWSYFNLSLKKLLKIMVFICLFHLESLLGLGCFDCGPLSLISENISHIMSACFQDLTSLVNLEHWVVGRNLLHRET